MQQKTNFYRQFELQLIDLTDWTEKEILQNIRLQLEYSKRSIDFKRNLWVELIKLYNNEFRKKFSDISLGSKLIFTQFHETFSSIDNDQRRVVFRERRLEDKEKVIYTNAVAKFDFEEMEMASILRELNWNILFFGSGILDVSKWNFKRKIIEVNVQSPFTFFIDPKAISIDNARFAGRYVYRTYYDLVNDSVLDSEKVKNFVKYNIFSTDSTNYLDLEKKAKQILLGENYHDEPLMPASYIEILEWYFYNNGKLWVVWVDSGLSNVLGFKKVDYYDKGGKESKIPFVFYNFIKTPFSIWGLGIPELIEDNHRADVILKNHMMKGIILDSMPSFLVNYEVLLNPKDLITKEINKIIWTRTSPVGQIEPFPKSQVVSNDTLSFVNILQNEAIGAIGSSRILKGSLTQVKKTATEIAIAKAKQDLQISSIMRNIIDGDKDFWNRWLKRCQKFLGENDKKLIELIGTYGTKSFKEVSKKDFIPEVDPVVEVVSSLEAEPQKIIRRRELSDILSVLAQSGGNVREVLRIILKDMDFTVEQIDSLLPPTPHELRASMENDLIENDELPVIHENDDDIQHISVHYRSKESEIRDIHIYSHFLNYLRKQNLEEPQKSKSKEKPLEEDLIEKINLLREKMPQDFNLLREGRPEFEAMDILKQNLFSSTPEEVK